MEMTQVLSSPAFAKFMDAKSFLEAKLATRVLDPMYTESLKNLYETGKDKEFMNQYMKRQELIGFDKISLEDAGEISEKEGEKLLVMFKDLWREYGETEPNVYEILPRILGIKTGAKGRDPEMDEAAEIGANPDAVLTQSRPDPDVDSVPKTSEVVEGNQEVHILPGVEQTGENGVAGS